MPSPRRLFNVEFMQYIASLIQPLATELNLNQIQVGKAGFLTPSTMVLDAVYIMPTDLDFDWGPRIQSTSITYDFRILYLRQIQTDGTDDVNATTITNTELIAETIADNKNFPSLASLFPGIFTFTPYTGQIVAVIPEEMTPYKIMWNPPEIKDCYNEAIMVDGSAILVKISAIAYKNTL